MLKITTSEGSDENPEATPMSAIRAFRRRDRLMIRTVKATLLVMALARFAAIALRAGSRRLSQMIW
jgi:hypothetical protein